MKKIHGGQPDMPLYRAARLVNHLFLIPWIHLAEQYLVLPELVACKDEFSVYSNICKGYIADVPKEECDLLKFRQLFKNKVPKLLKVSEWI